jgi:anti-sigma regulatory factor (Ser/Thr protein kinase)
LRLVSTLRLQLEGAPSDVPVARRAITDALVGERADVVETARLLVTEVVTNVVIHARTSCTIEVRRTPGSARVLVTDHSAALPQPRVHGAEASTGRGLRLLGTLASAWGITRSRGRKGKTVWFEVDLLNAPETDEALAEAFAGDWLAEFERVEDDLVLGSDR